MPEVVDWLKTLGMAEYAERFAESDIDTSVLCELTDQDLKELGVSLGHRRKMLRAIAELVGAVQAPPQPALTKSKPEDTAERRQVTVMFSDLVGSTALSARMDPEDLRKVISAYQKCTTETVRRFGGFVAKYMGDGVLVYFGYPQAHEDDAERAVRAGLELIEAVGGLKSSAPLQTRVGIATGLVVVGDLIGSGAAQEQAVVGETPNVAARMQGVAEPNTVVIAESTRKLLGNLFELEDLGAKDLKGIAGPAHAWAALRASSVESRFEALRTATTPLVGREEEIELLMRRWEQAKRGEGCVVLISGEPGIGKSRIAQTVLDRLSGEPHTRLRYFCSPHHQDSALYPSIMQLERAAEIRRDDTNEQRLAKLETVLAQATNDFSEAVPLLAELLSIPTGDRYPPLNLTPQKRKERTLHAQMMQVERLAARQPVLMVFEDVHWSDPTTRESLDRLIDRVPALRVLVILTFRPEFAPPWVGRPQVTLLSLNRLPSRRRAEMIMHLTGGKVLPKEIADQIIDRTDGIPLFIEELTKAVVESGVLIDAGNRYTVAGVLPPLAIPTTLNASLLARLDRLAPVREVAQIGAALGRQFSHELISAVSPMPPQQLDDALTQLVSTELMFRRGSPPDAEYTFKHALVQDAAYGTLLRSRRQQLHGRITATLESRFLEIVETQPEVLARHCGEAGLVEKAVGYWLKAGQQAITRWAMTEAVALLRKGLDLLSGVPDGAARQDQELDLQIALGHALIATKGWPAPEPGKAFARARQLCEQLNRPAQLGPVLVGQYLFRTRPRGAGPGGTPCRGDASPGRNPERRDVEMLRLEPQRDCLLLAWQVHRRPPLQRECSLLMGPGVSRPRSGDAGFIPAHPVKSFPDVALPRLCRPGAFAAGPGAGRGATALALQSGFRAKSGLVRRRLGERRGELGDDASIDGRAAGHLERARLPPVFRNWEHHARLVSGHTGAGSGGHPTAPPRASHLSRHGKQLAVVIFSHDARGGLWDGGAAGRRAQSAGRGRQVGRDDTSAVGRG